MIIFTIDKNLNLFIKKILAIFSNVFVYIIIDLKKIKHWMMMYGNVENQEG
jgi:hypothetical protein